MVQHIVSLDQDFAGLRIDHVGRGQATEEACPQGLPGDIIRFPDPDAFGGVAVVVVDDDILGHIDQAAGQVTGVGGSQGGVSQAFAGAVCGDEVLQGVQAFAEVRADGQRDDAPGWVGHQATHTGKLRDGTEAAFGCARDRLGCQIAIRIHGAFHCISDHIRGALPDFDHTLVFLLLGEQTTAEITLDRLLFGQGFIDNLGLSPRAR